MDKTTVRELLGGALSHEPPIGPVARNALQAGIRLRRRRRAQRVAGIMAGIAVVVATIPVVARSHGSATAAAPARAIMYVVAANGVTPVATATNKPGKRIKLGTFPGPIAITPNGKTAYIANRVPGTVIPISTATNKPGRPIKLAGGFAWATAIAITPEGRTAYIANWDRSGRHDSGTVTPVATATNTPGKPIKVSGIPAAIAITPDGSTAYVVSTSPTETTVIPVATATNTPGKPIKLAGGSFPPAASIAITPDGSTAYVVKGHARRTTVTPVATATNTPGRPIELAGGSRDAAAIAITPDGRTAYIGGGRDTVVPVATATNTPGRPIKLSGAPVAIAITRDGRTAYIGTTAYSAGTCPGCPVGTVIPVSIATDTPGKPISIGRTPRGIAITP